MAPDPGVGELSVVDLELLMSGHWVLVHALVSPSLPPGEGKLLPQKCQGSIIIVTLIDFFTFEDQPALFCFPKS